MNLPALVLLLVGVATPLEAQMSATEKRNAAYIFQAYDKNKDNYFDSNELLTLAKNRYVAGRRTTYDPIVTIISNLIKTYAKKDAKKGIYIEEFSSGLRKFLKEQVDKVPKSVVEAKLNSAETQYANRIFRNYDQNEDDFLDEKELVILAKNKYVPVGKAIGDAPIAKILQETIQKFGKVDAKKGIFFKEFNSELRQFIVDEAKKI